MSDFLFFNWHCELSDVQLWGENKNPTKTLQVISVQNENKLDRIVKLGDKYYMTDRYTMNLAHKIIAAPSMVWTCCFMFRVQEQHAQDAK